MCVNNIKVDKKKESKTTPHVSTNISAYDRVVQIVTNDNNEIKPEEEANKNTYDYLDNYLSFFLFCLKFSAFKLIRTCFIVSLCVKYYVINSCCIGCNPYFTIYNITIR